MKRKSIVALVAAVALICGGCTVTTESQNDGQSADAGSQTDSSVEQAELDNTTDDADNDLEEMGEQDKASEEAEENEDKSAAGETENGDNGDSKAETSPAQSADYWALIQEYGFTQKGYSILSYTLHGDTLKDEGDYYTVEATFAKPVPMPENPQEGEEYVITVDELNGTTRTITCVGESQFVDENESDIYAFPEEGFEGRYLYEYSDDRIDCDFYEGTLCIRKDAVTGAAILQQPYETIKEEDISGGDHWFNGLKFDDEGFVTELIFFGD